MNNIGSTNIIRVGLPYSNVFVGAKGPVGPTGPTGPTGSIGGIGFTGSAGIGVDFLQKVSNGITVFLVGGQAIEIFGFTGNAPTDFSGFLAANPNPYNILEATGSEQLTINFVDSVNGFTATFKQARGFGNLTIDNSGNDLIFTGTFTSGILGLSGAMLFAGSGETIYPAINNNNDIVFKYESKDSTPYSVNKGLRVFYEGGITAATLAYYDNLGAKYMPSIYQGEVKSIWGDIVSNGITISSIEAGLTGGNITSAVSVLTSQGITSSSRAHIILHLQNPWLEKLIFNGYTGPKTALEISDNNKAVSFYDNFLSGGVGTDSISFNGLKSYFPSSKFGIANVPGFDNLYPAYPDPYYNDLREIWGYSESQRNDIIDQIANTYVTDNLNLIDSIDILMPIIYPTLNSTGANEFIAKHKIKICNAINSKLTSKKEIIPIISPFYWTNLSAIPYVTGGADIYGFTFEAIPPYTVLTETESKQQQYTPVLEEEADGIVVWGAVKGLYSGGLLGQTVGIPPGVVNFNDIPTNFQGITGITNGYSYKSLWRQAISAHLNFVGGSAPNNRWIYEGVTFYTPNEWLPLEQNNPGSTSSVSTTTQINNLFTNLIYNELNYGISYLTTIDIASGIFGGLIQENETYSGSTALNLNTKAFPFIGNSNDTTNNAINQIKSYIDNIQNTSINFIIQPEPVPPQRTGRTWFANLITTNYAGISSGSLTKNYSTNYANNPTTGFRSLIQKSPLNIDYTKKEYGSCCYCDDAPNVRTCLDYVEKSYCEDTLGGSFESNTSCSNRIADSNCNSFGACCINNTCVETSEFLCRLYGGNFRGGSCLSGIGPCN